MNDITKNKAYTNIQSAVDIKNSEGIRCVKCDIPLELTPVKISYLKSTFPTKILRCPVCGLNYISEELALGKMVEVEQLLEEK